MTGTLFLLFTAVGMALVVLALSVAGLTSLAVWAPLSVVATLSLATLVVLGSSDSIAVRSDG